MRQIDFTPTGYEGSVKLTLPNSIERLRYFKECSFKVENGETGLAVEGMGDKFETMARFLEISKKHVGVVNLAKGETKYASYDEMLDDPACMDACLEVAMAVINGARLGNG